MTKKITKKGAHEEFPFDKYELYSKSVQSPETDVEFLRDTYKSIRGVLPKTLCEDFCGTFMISCEWVKLHKNFKAIGIDLDLEPIAYGKSKYLSKLKPEQQSRLQLIQSDVMNSELPKTDIVLAANFSYFVFRDRARMREYFSHVRERVNDTGIFVMDCFGGSHCFDSNEENTKHKDFTYYWEQLDFDPVSNRASFAIHFKPKGKKKFERVFTYDWRMWTIPELREILEEAGFSKTTVYWEGTKKDGTGNGIFKPAVVGESCQSWIAYIVAEK